MSTPTSLKIGPISYVPFDNYPKNFTFIVNKEKFHTNKLIADLLSRKISKIHLSDPLTDQYEIITEYPGDFQKILDIIKVDNFNIEPSELPFITEVTKELEININIDPQQNQQLTLDNVLDQIRIHEKYENFYSNFLNEEIEFAAENFFKLKDTQEDSLLSLLPDTIQKILSSTKLCLESEDQLLDFVNKLYKSNRKLSCFYDFVIFSNVGNNTIDQFASIFNIDDITQNTWNCILKRLLNIEEDERTSEPRYVTNQKHHHQQQRYKQQSNREQEQDRNINQQQQQQQQQRYIRQNNGEQEQDRNINQQQQQQQRYIRQNNREQEPFTGTVFDGIFNRLKRENSLDRRVNVTVSSDGCGFDQKKVILHDNNDFTFYTRDIPNSWICFIFNRCQVSVTHYTIRTDKWNKMNGNHPRSWVIEGFRDNQWETLDERINDPSLNGAGFVHTFAVQRNSNVMYSHIRMRLTDVNWNNKNYLMLNSFEIYGNISR